MNKKTKRLIAFALGWLCGRLFCAIVAHNGRLMEIERAGQEELFVPAKTSHEAYRMRYGAGNPVLN